MQSVFDKPVLNVNGFFVLMIFLGLTAFLYLMVPPMLVGPIMIILAALIITGFTILGPNEAKVITFFGTYMGTITHSGFRWTIPFSNASLVPLKMLNFNTDKLKVNDLNGNPIEVGAVVVWRVRDAAQACFNVDDYKQFIFNQSESTIRTIAAKYPYDSEKQSSLRGNADEITRELKKELHEKLNVAGIEVEEVKLSHLAYAPEIAAAMLKRQQAVAVLEARRYMIENAAVIAEGVIENLLKKTTMNLSDDKKAQIMSNILVTLISDKEVSPVIDL